MMIVMARFVARKRDNGQRRFARESLERCSRERDGERDAPRELVGAVETVGIMSRVEPILTALMSE